MANERRTAMKGESCGRLFRKCAAQVVKQIAAHRREAFERFREVHALSRFMRQ